IYRLVRRGARKIQTKMVGIKVKKNILLIAAIFIMLGFLSGCLNSSDRNDYISTKPKSHWKTVSSFTLSNKDQGKLIYGSGSKAYKLGWEIISGSDPYLSVKIYEGSPNTHSSQVIEKIYSPKSKGELHLKNLQQEQAYTLKVESNHLVGFAILKYTTL
ncbi:MAG: hypothetical protein V5A68_08350, partial [Candidatus Thermoplasmatota archaeon]